MGCEISSSPTIGDAIRSARDLLAESGSESPALDAEVLMMHVLGADRTALYLARQDVIDLDALHRFHTCVERRWNGEPVAYITGYREFYGLEFCVSPDVLVPRPETEQLVEWALERARKLDLNGHKPLIIDVGTGSGAIAASIAHHRCTQPGTVIGSDVSLPALRVADENRRRLGPSELKLVAGNLLEWFDGRADIIIANLPYLHPEQAHDGLAYEPEVALFVAGGGFELYRAFLPQAADRLTSNGIIMCELDPSIAGIAKEAAREVFPQASIRIVSDLAQTERYLLIDREDTLA